MSTNNIRSSWDDIPELISTTPFDIEMFSKYSHKESSILDIGCGYGRICKQLEESGYKHIVGVDSSEILLKRASSSLIFTKLILSDALSMPLINEQFDVAISFGVINCLTKKNDFEVYALEVDRLLKPGGYFLVNEFTRNDSEYFEKKYSVGAEKYKLNRVFKSNTGLVYRHYSIAEILSVFDPYFDLVRCERHDFLSLNHSRKVNGYSFVLQKLIYNSKFR